MLYQPPPPLPPNYIPRAQLLDAITKAVMSSKVDISVSTTVTLLGFGGFGKTTLATGLCHQPTIQQHFLDGVLWIKLGPKPPDPEMMLVKLYDQLTNEKLQQSNFSMADKLRWYVSSYLKRLLVIIDDVWEAQDAKIYADTFSTCKIVLTTRKSNVSTHIPTKNIIKIEEMSIEESKILLTYRVVDTNKLNSSAIKNLETLAQNLHRWPLLLGLVRNQLHSQITLQSSINQAVCKVQQALYDKGLTAFDSNIDSHSSKENAVKACVDATLDLLTQNELSNLKVLVLYAGTGVKIPKSSLNYFWIGDVDDNLEKLSSCGLITITRMALPPSICTLSCVEMHAVVTQYLVDSMDFGTLKQIFEGVNIANIQFIDWGFGSPEIVEDILEGLVNKIDFETLQSDEKESTLFQLQFTIGLMDNLGIPFCIQRTVILTKIILQDIIEKLELFSERFKQNPQLLSLLIKFKEENTLKVEKAYMRFIKTYKEIQSFLALDNYEGIMSAFKRYLKNHPIQSLVDNFFKLAQKLKQNCKGDDALLSFIMEKTGTDNEKRNDFSLEICLSCFEHQIKLRFAYVKLNKPSITMEEYLDATMDLTISHLKWFDTNIINKNRELVDNCLESFDPKDEDVKASFDALIGTFSNMFERFPDLKESIAEMYSIDGNLPLEDFILSMCKKYMLATPRTM